MKIGQRNIAWMGVLFFAAAAAGGSAAYGRQWPASSDSPPSAWQQPGQVRAVNFSLSPFRAGRRQRGRRTIQLPLSFSPQQQPFVEPAAVRLRDDDPEYIKKISPLGGHFEDRLLECVYLGGRQVCF